MRPPMAGLPNSEAPLSVPLKALGSTRRPLPTLPIEWDFTPVPRSRTTATSATAALSAMVCITVEPGHRGYVSPGTCNTNWDYDTNMELAVLFAVLLGVGAFHHGLLDRMVFGVRGPRVTIAFLCLSARVVMAGGACQQAYVLVFTAFAARFHYVAAQLKRKKYPLPMFRPWATTLATLYLSFALPTTRDIFQLASWQEGGKTGAIRSCRASGTFTHVRAVPRLGCDEGADVLSMNADVQ
ncbi:hypothetical protein DL766_006289 [Monosporascus sp. MC13-8B]|uniref:Uncharacterized protein n=1 Tax=Monosporascus cannonballus TaxID=155416 RepID=A0ABY0H9F8_9PEZI|nr:hypothetical protein DL762_003836 [Monosporascus cannonballus]RYO92829.1 hypothetical protein DL763_004554 [Monosporascus cannonballus]RYP27694.1 hypothetical protein DL766_006289 [Monosporascus sp. MC13-8B]